MINQHYFQIIKFHLLSQILIIVLITIGNFIWRDLIPENNGFGWDGYSNYKPLLLDCQSLLLNHKLDGYSIQRIFPFCTGHYLIRLVHAGFSDKSLIFHFQIYQFIVLLLIQFFWYKITAFLRLSKTGFWLGFLGLIVTFATLKLDFYYPILSDRSALLLGLASLYFYLRQNTIGLLISAIIGTVTWPTLILINAILFLFPYQKTVLPLNKDNDKLIHLIILFVCGYVLFWMGKICVYAVTTPKDTIGFWYYILVQYLPFSIVGCILYLYYSLRGVSSGLVLNIKSLIQHFSTLPWRNYIGLSLLIIWYIALKKIIANTDLPVRLAGSTFLSNIALASIMKPLSFIIQHTIYFGPLIVLIILYFKDYCKKVQNLGFGFVLIIGAGLIQSINSESRQLLALLPFFILPIVLVLEDIMVSKRALIITTIISIGLSKFYLPINWIATNILKLEKATFLDLTKPDSAGVQLYMMQQGPWVSTRFYIINTVIVILTIIIMFLAFRLDKLKKAK
jgi:hypothetical protein